MAIRVLVVEDSTTVRHHLVETLRADPEFEVVGEAADGRAAFEQCSALRPDVVTLDMMLPVMTGLAATEQIMAFCPTPILIVSSSTNRGELFETYHALAAGAVDALEKPDGTEPEGEWEARFRSTVKLVSRIRVITHVRARLGAPAPQPPADPRPRRVVAMGASTGGPGAVLHILRALTSDYPLPILLVIHVGKPFAASLAEWLQREAPMEVSLATDGMPLPKAGTGGVFLAPADRHLVLERGRLRLSADPPRYSCRPSVDVLFESVAREIGDGAIGCLLTGMGRDGAEGLLAIRGSGGLTIAQDEASSVIFGMPREAIALGAAEQVLPVERIPGVLLSSASTRREGR